MFSALTLDRREKVTKTKKYIVLKRVSKCILPTWLKNSRIPLK